MDAMSQESASRPNIFEPGTIIDDRYELLAMLRHGPAGVVYEARGVLVDKPVTLTILHSLGCDAPRCAERNFLRSAQAASDFDHPNVVTIRDFGFADASRRCYLVRDQLEGVTLSQAIAENGAVGSDRLLNLLIPCAEALAEGHDTGLVHGHVSTSSVWFSAPGQERESLRLMDFGVPCVDTCECPSPEARHASTSAAGDKAQSAAEDVFQMALVALEAATGSPVVWRLTVDSGEGQLSPVLPDALAATPLGLVLMRALSPRHEERFAHGMALVRALVAVRRGVDLDTLERQEAAA